MRIVFMGSSEASAECLHAILREDELEVVGVVTQPDRPVGRGKAGRAKEIAPCPLAKFAAARGLTEIIKPERVNDDEPMAWIRAKKPDVIAVVAYGQILKKPLLDLPLCGCINCHFSLLPKYRGAAPVIAALEAGDRLTGVTVMRMGVGLDDGPIMLQSFEPIYPDTTGGALMDDLDVNDPRIFTLRLTGAENAQVSTLMYMLQVSVTSDDNQVYVSFDSTAVSRYESSGSVDLKVRLSVAAPQEVKVWIAVDEESSTAVEGTDYTLEESVLELAFAPGEMEKTFTVGLIDNSVVDANKVLSFDIDRVENAEPLEGMAECALTITNDDMDFVQLYDDLMGNWTLTTDTKVYTATISGGSSLAEENANYLNRLMLTVDNTGNAGTAMTLYIDYDVNTGAMSVVLPQLIKENLTVSFWEGQVYQTADHYLFYRNSGGAYVDEEITIQLDWNLDYTNCSWNLNGGDLSCQLCPVGTMDRTAWGIYDFRWASMTLTKN